MPTIPTGLRPQFQNYSLLAPGGVVRTDVGGGLPRYRLDWDQGRIQVQFSMMLKAVEFSVWTAFFTHVLKNGLLAFDMPLNTGFGIDTHQVQIVPGTYSAQWQHDEAVMVSFVGETESAAYGLTSAEALDLIAAFEAANGPLLDVLRPRIASFAFEGPAGVVRGDVPGGAPGYAAAWQRGCQQYRVTIPMNATEFEAWTTFFHHLAKKGAVAFNMYLDSAFGAAEHSVHVVPGSYTAVLTGGGARAEVSFLVDAESKAYDLSASEANSLIDLFNGTGSDMHLLLARIAQFANVDTLVLS